MRSHSLLSTLCLPAAIVCATSAVAGEARVEASGGMTWEHGETEAIAGLGAGYDFDLGESLFAGPVVSMDKELKRDSRVSFGFGGRVGVKATEADKLFLLSGYQTKPCRNCGDAVNLGAGYEHTLFDRLFGKIEYRHLFKSGPEPEVIVVGLGFTL